MIVGYFDEAYKGQEFVCMTGYLADDSQWRSLTIEWNRLLEKYSIPYLHLSDFLSSWDIYKDWKNYPDRKEKIRHAIDDFCNVVSRYTFCGVGIGIDTVAYKNITASVEKREKPEVFCFERVLRRVIECLNEWKWDEKILIVFDDNKKVAMKQYSRLCEIKERHQDVAHHISGIAFGDDKYFPDLQAADLLCYATKIEFSKGNDGWGKDSPFRKLLLSESPAYGKLYRSEYWDEAELEKQKDKICVMCSCRD